MKLKDDGTGIYTSTDESAKITATYSPRGQVSTTFVMSVAHPGQPLMTSSRLPILEAHAQELLCPKSFWP